MNSVISAFKTKKNANNNVANEKKQQQQQQSANCLEQQQQQQQNSLSPKHNQELLATTTTTTTTTGVMMIAAVPSAPTAALKKKATNLNTQDNGYQYLRQIREIDTATKILSPIFMAADESNDMLNFSPTPTPTTSSVDVVDNAATTAAVVVKPIDMDKLSADLNSNNVEQPLQQQQHNISNKLLEQDDDESEEHSAAACTSSSSEHSCSTVLRSPLSTSGGCGGGGFSVGQQSVSPSKSLKLSLSTKTLSSSSSSPSLSSCSSTISASSTTSPITTSLPSVSATVLSSLSLSTSLSVSPTSSSACSPTAKNVSPTPSMQSLSPTTIQTTANGDDDYIPAFLKPTPLTLPIRLPNNNASVLYPMPPCLKPSNMSSSTAGAGGNGQYAMTMNYNSATPKHTRSKPRLSLSRFLNHSMPSVHGRGLSLSVAGDANPYNSANSSANQPPKRMSTHQRNLSLDFR